MVYVPNVIAVDLEEMVGEWNSALAKCRIIRIAPALVCFLIVLITNILKL